MVVPSASWVSAITQARNGGQVPDVPGGWSTEPALYTDLNAPVIDSSGTANFPIIDGHLATATVSSSSVLTYCTSGTTPDIEGFYIPPGTVPNYNISNPISATNNPAPMPVQWMFILKDGTVISPDPVGTVSASGSTATFSQAAQAGHAPAAGNPIVGRIAFWTDDETCKLNINTASEGTYYAMPHANTNTEISATNGKAFGFAISPPGTGEYNRYPGHPAATCLSVAMGTWIKSASDQYTPGAYTSRSNDQSYLADLANYLMMVPRTGTGGSLAGTVNLSGTTFNTITTPANRLFDSFDELIFNPSRTPNSAASGPPQTYLTKGELEELKFFLTANSRAPELTPFNTPKVSLWPQWYSASDRQKYQGAAQKLLAFCSSFGTVAPGSSASGKNEYFWKWDSSSVRTINMPNITPGGPSSAFASNSSCSSSLDWTSVPRNQQLATYLCNLGDHNIPGYGAAFRSTTKYSDRCFSNIVLECLDYIRSCIARADYESPASVNVGGTVSGTTSENTTEYSWTAPLMVADIILPGVSASNPIKGFGYFPIFPEVVLGEGVSATSGTTVPFLAFNSFTAPWSYPGGQQNMFATITGLTNLGLIPSGGKQVANPIPINRRVSAPAPYAYVYGRNLPMHVYVADLTGYQFSTVSIGGTTNVTLGGGGLPAQISFADGVGRAFQTMNVTFKRTNVPVMPTLASTDMNNDSDDDWYYEVEDYASHTHSLFLPGHCVARGMECNANPTNVAAGDWRILGGTVNAASANAPIASGTTGNLFSILTGSATAAQIHTLRVYSNSLTQPIINGTTPTSSIAGTLAPSLSGTGTPILSSTEYGDISAPFASQGMQGAMNYNHRPGDWDTGAGVFPDGPYLNVVDQLDASGASVYFPSASANTGSSLDFSPNKRIASAIQFGSLPTGVSAAPPGSPQSTLSVQPRPWETLLFCPNPPARSTAIGTPLPLGGSEHIGFANPPDHLFLQFFTLPVVQPYAISEPFSTAGKVNLNYQLAPFTNIERSTALRGVLKNTLVAGISGYDVKSQTYKVLSNTPSNSEIRYDINRDATIDGIDETCKLNINTASGGHGLCLSSYEHWHGSWDATAGLSQLCKFRVISTKKFAP